MTSPSNSSSSGALAAIGAIAASERRISVLPSYGRQADVPWNAPFYASCGFVETIPDSAFHRRLVETEKSLRLDAHGRWIQMTAPL